MNATSRGSGGRTSTPSIRRPSADPQRPTDLQLVMDMGRKDAAAIRQLYGRLAPLIFSVARRITGIAEDAEEVLVDTFHQAWAHAHMYDPSRATVEGWMVNIVRSRAIDRVRSRRRWQKGNDKAAETPEAFPTYDPPNPERETIRGEENARLHEAIAALPADQKRTLELAYFSGLSQSEIADRLGQPLGTVKTRLRLALSKIRAALTSVEGSQ